MLKIPETVLSAYDRYLADQPLEERVCGLCRKWLRYYLDFCDTYDKNPLEATCLAPFLAKLAEKKQTPTQQRQATQAVQFYYDMITPEQVVPAAEEERLVAEEPPIKKPPKSAGSWQDQYQAMEDAIRLRHYSPKTLQTYRMWTKKFQAFTHSKAPSQLSTDDVKAFLTDLAVEKNVAASTQNQAFNGLLFFFRHALGREFGKVEGVVRAKRKRYIPVVLSRQEIDTILTHLAHPYHLVIQLLYGCGLRISECLDLRIQCFNLDQRVLTVHDGKGGKDRTVPLPTTLLPAIQEQFKRVHALLQEDLEQGSTGVFLPKQLEKKYKNAPRDFVWQWFFPALRLTRVPKTGELRRYHLQASHVGKALNKAVKQTAIPKRVTPHTFRHSFASHLLQANFDIRTIQELLGHSDLKTTMIYTHTVQSRTLKEARSPLDL